MDINGGNMGKKSPGIIPVQELISSVLLHQVALLKRRCKEVSMINQF
ncbi:hypothetical protein Goari_005227 [Gossypium aridum]|uniref:Uncharacterized protein n=1 Tax=Gossypium aridum TaxID=34290 RepID=A0A7J8Y5X9_GOSAI|nr:hypothetical protein [Gossypium aridum]